MISIRNKADCCGCNACGDICPRHAISFHTDQEGFWYPEVDAQACIDCGLCEKVCPVLNAASLKQNDLAEPVCYAAEHKNLEVIFDSTSGGLFSAMAEIVYRAGGSVGGAVFNDDLSVRHFISNDKKDLPRLRSSKYLQSSLEGFFTQVRDLVKDARPVLVCGTPCQMAALRAFLGKVPDNLIIADFICRGINSPKVWQKYIRSFEERYGSPVVYAKAKSKEYGWRKLTQKVILADGRHLYETLDQSNFTKGYLRTNVYCRPSCYDCKFKGFPRIADITLADFWGIEKVDRSMEKDLGTSLVLLNSDKGVRFFEQFKARIHSLPVPFESILAGNPALVRPLDPPTVDREQFFRDLDQMNFTQLADKYINTTPAGFKRRLKSFLKKSLSLTRMLLSPSTSLIKTCKYSKLKDIFKGNYLRITRHTATEISRSAKLDIHGPFLFGWKRIKGSRLESRLLVEDDATLATEGSVKLFYGADVEVFKGATLTFKGGILANTGLTIICGERIEIGKDVQIGRGVTIRDNNGGHYLNRAGYKDTRPVVIGDKVWLCEGCTIMPGVKIGDGAIIGAHAFVTSNVPAHAMVSGNPAAVVDEDVLWKY